MRISRAAVCAVKEALTLTVLSELLKKDLDHVEGGFLRASRPYLLEEPVHWQGEAAYRLFHDEFLEFVAQKHGARAMSGHHCTLARALCA